MKIIVVNEWKDHKEVIKVKQKITEDNWDSWLEEMDEFAQDELQDLGVYEFDGWDLKKSFIQIPDDNDDWLEDFNKVVEKVRDKVC